LNATDPHRRRWATWSARIAGIVFFLAALATICQVLGISDLGGAFSGDSESVGSWGNLRLQDPVGLTNGSSHPVMVGETSDSVRSSLPQIDFTVRNEGKGRVALGRLRIEVTESARITPCLPPQGGEGAVPIDESFFVDLPLLPTAAEGVIYRQLHQEVLARRATRVKVYFRSLGGSGEELFAIRVTLLGTGSGQSLDVGRFVLSTPGSIPFDDLYLPETEASLEHAQELQSVLPSTWCFRRNRGVVRHFLALPGQRSPELQAHAPTPLPAWWNRMTDRRPPAAAVGPLLRSGDFFLGPVLAMFAAERARSRSLMVRTRRKAVATLRHDVEASFAQGPEAGANLVVDARVLSYLNPSQQSDLLRRRAEAVVGS
jgi:hypothetical protein